MSVKTRTGYQYVGYFPQRKSELGRGLDIAGLDGLRIFHSKNVGEPIEYSRCLPLACFNKFVLTQKSFICLLVTKQYQPFCARTGGDALKVEKRWIITFYFKTRTVDVGECRTSPAALVKTAQ